MNLLAAHRSGSLACVALVLVGTMLGADAARRGSPTPARAASASAGPYLRFEANRGQAAGDVRFLARGVGRTLLLSDTEATLVLRSSSSSLRPATVRWRVAGANPAKARGEQPLRTRVNYLRGNDPSRWQTRIPTYAEVRTDDVYPGIDLKYYGREGQVEYDFLVAPGADPRQIRLAVSGGEPAIDAKGDLVLATTAGEVRQHKPVCYQEVAGTRVPVEGSFVLAANRPLDDSGAREVSFQLGAYDRSLPLVIDPVFSYSTYLGGTDSEEARAVAVDADGSAYVTGSTVSGDFPASPGSLDTTYNFGNDAFVAKVAPDGQSLEWATYLGGGGDDYGIGIGVSGKSAYVAGMTTSDDFPTTAGAFDRTLNGGTDAFVARLSDDGSSLTFGTFYGGTGDEMFNDAFFVRAGGLAVDGAGNATITGVTDSAAIPRVNAAQNAFGGGQSDAFVACISQDGSTLLYGSYLGGSGDEDLFGAAVAVDSAGFICVTGETQSTNFPVTATAFQAARLGASDAFVTRLDPSKAGAAGFAYSTYFGGGSNEGGTGIAVDNLGKIYLVGGTTSSQGEVFPLKGAFQPLFGGGGDGFLSKLDPTLVGAASLVYSSYLGGSGSNETANAVAVDSQRAAYVTGFTSSDTDFPLVDPLQATFGGGGGDGFVTKVNPAGSAMVYSTYLGGSADDVLFSQNGIATDSNRNAYVVGYTDSGNFPTFAALQGSIRGGRDAFVTKLCESIIVPAAPDQLTATGVSSSSIRLDWRDNSSVESGYRIERRSGGGPFTQFAQVNASVVTFTNTGLTPNTSFDYRVRAFNSCGLSPFTPPTTGTTLPLPPAAPTALTATVPAAPDGQTRIQLAWTDNANNETGFKIERKTGAGAFTEVAQVGPNVMAFLDTNLAPNTTFTYRMRAFNTGGNSAFSNQPNAKTLPLAPAAPSGLVVTVPDLPDGRTKLRLAWSDNSNNETGFRVERRTGGGAFAEVRQTGPNVVTIFDENLTPNTTFDYRVSAFNTGGSSAASNVASGTTLRALGGTLEAPASVNFRTAKRGKEKRVDITLRNVHASEILRVDPVTTTGKFTIVKGGEPVDLKPGQELVVTVAFRSKKKGVNKGTMTLTSSDPKRANVTIQLKAKVK